MHMKWIGLTGGIATGKSTVANILREMGLPVVDADGLARELTQKGNPVLMEIKNQFGESVIQQNGELDRRRLGQIVFSDSLKLAALEKILHPKIQDLKTKAKLHLENTGVPIAFYEVPLLFEKNLQADFDAIIVVLASPEVQRQRMQTRDGLSLEEIESRLRNQIPT